MRQLILLSLFVCFAAGCGKKQPPPPTDARIGTDAPTEEPTAVTRANLFTDLKGSNQKTKREAAEELSAWVESDPESVTELLNLLKDKSTTGAGKILPNQINSTREAAALTLLWSGPKGEAILKDKGLAILRAGLIDPQPAIREHTIYTIGLLGPLARPLSAEVMQLCTSADANIRGRAFDTLALIGVTDVAGFAHLLNHANGEVGKDAARLVPTFPDISSAAIAPLTLALESTDLSIRVAAAVGLARAGPTAAPAAMALQEALKKSYPAEYNPNEPYQPGAELVFWEALRQIGEAAVVPTTDLLTHTNPIVRAYAAKTLGEIGPASRSATEKLKAALKDTTLLNVPIEAACALCAIGAGKDEAIEVLKRAIDTPSAPAQFAAAAQFAIETIPRLGEAGKPLYPLALSKLTSDNPFARFAAVGLVATLPTAEGATYAIALGKLATDPLPDIRNRVALVLEKLGPTAAPAGEALGKAFSVETVEPIRDHVLDALIALGPGAKPALPLLLPLVREATLSTPARRLRVIGAIAVADPSSKDVLAALLTAVNDDDATTRAAVATALGKLDPLPPEALAKLVALANSDKGSNPRLAAIRALARAGARAKPAKTQIEAIAAGPQPGLALWAKVALAALDGELAKAAPAVRAALVDKVAVARAAAAEALLLVGPLASDLPVLTRLLKDPASDTRQAAARCIGALGAKAKEAVPQLVSLLNDRDGDVRIAAAEALGEMGAAGLPALEKLRELQRDPTAESAARKAVEKLTIVDKKP